MHARIDAEPRSAMALGVETPLGSGQEQVRLGYPSCDTRDRCRLGPSPTLLSFDFGTYIIPNYGVPRENKSVALGTSGS